MKDRMIQDWQKLHKGCLIAALIHWILTFFTDHLIFEYVMWDVSNMTQIIKTAMTYGAKAVFLLVLIGIYQGAHYLFTKADKRFVKYTLIYFGANMVLLFLTWPGIWRMDEFGILNSAILLLPVFWQNYLTSLFYVFSLMLIPVPAGVIIVQCVVNALIVGYLVKFLVEKFGKWGLLGFIPFFFLPVLDSNLYPMRMCIYAFLELLLLVLLYKKWECYKSAKKQEGHTSVTKPVLAEVKAREPMAENTVTENTVTENTVTENAVTGGMAVENGGSWLFICILAAIITVWRTEAIYYFVLFPILLVILYIKQLDKKKLLHIICAYLVCALCLFIPQTVGDKLTSGNQYDLTSVVLPLVPLVEEAYESGDCEEQLSAIDQVINVELAVEGAKGGRSGISLFWSEPDFQRNYTDAQYGEFKSAYYELVLKFPTIFLKERWECFLQSSDLLQNTTELFAAEGVANYETFKTYPAANPINEELRSYVIEILEWRDLGDYETKKDGYSLIYSHIVPIGILVLLWLGCMLKRKWHLFFLISLPFVKVPLIFLTAPSRLFMYYYSLYLIGYFALVCLLIKILAKLWDKVGGPVQKTVNYAKRNGVKAAYYAAMERIDHKHTDEMTRKAAAYAGCKEWSFTLSEEELTKTKEEQRNHRFAYEPLISIVVPTYETDTTFLNELLESVKGQTYSKWELVIADASKSDKVKDVLFADRMTDEVIRKSQNVQVDFESQGVSGRNVNCIRSKIRYIRLAENKGISDNTNAAIEEAKGDYIALLDHDDVLTLDALYSMVEKLNEALGLVQTKSKEEIGNVNKAKYDRILAIYSDEDKCDGAMEHFYEPHLKPDFNLDLLLSNNYICHFLMVEASAMKEMKLRRDYDGAQDYDLILRLAAKSFKENKAFLHVNKVLYHWRCHQGSTAGNTESKRYAYDAGRHALEAYFEAYLETYFGTGSAADFEACFKTDSPTSLVASTMADSEMDSGTDSESESGVDLRRDLEIELRMDPRRNSETGLEMDSEIGSMEEIGENKMQGSVSVTHSLHLGFYKVEYKPDIFAVRPDVAAICGSVIHKGIVVGGPFTGLRETSSGYMHRASLYMDCSYLANADVVGTHKIGTDVAGIHETCTDDADTCIAGIDERALKLRPDLDCSLEEALAKGMKVVYDPEFKIVV